METKRGVNPPAVKAGKSRLSVDDVTLAPPPFEIPEDAPKRSRAAKVKVTGHGED